MGRTLLPCRDFGIVPEMYGVKTRCLGFEVLPIEKLDNEVFDVKHAHLADRSATVSQFTFGCWERGVPKMAKCLHWRELHIFVIPDCIRTLYSSHVDE